MLCQMFLPVTFSQSELCACVFKALKLDVQTRPVFADLVTYLIVGLSSHVKDLAADN